MKARLLRILSTNGVLEAQNCSQANLDKLTDQRKADFRQHLPNLMEKFQWVTDSIGLRSSIAAVDEATGTDQPSGSGSG